jgi:hypothetical protein
MVRGSRSWLVGILAGAACLIAAPSAFAIVDTVNLTRFSKTVSGNTPGFAGSVTVDLLRNVIAADGTVVREQVDTFTAPVDGSFNWSGSFTKHAFSTGDDQVEVNYSGTPARMQVTIGGGRFLPSATIAGVSHKINARADRLDGRFGVASDGTTMNTGSCGCNPVTATVNGVAAPVPVSNKITFSSPVSNADTILITGSFSSLGTVAKLTDAAPLLTPLPADQTPPVTRNTLQPDCDFYLNTTEAVCHQLTPGAYTLAHIRGPATLASQTLTVPTRAATSSLIPSQAASTPFANVAAGDQFRLMAGPRVLTTLTVNPFTVDRLAPFGLLSDAVVTISGTCTPQIFFPFDSVLCPGGTIPPNTSLGGANLSLRGSGFNFIGGSEDLGQLDDTSPGGTEIDMPSVALHIPGDESGVRVPFVVLAFTGYNEPRALVANENNRPANGPTPTLASTPSNAPVNVSIAPLGSSSFRSLGNANRPGGITVGTLAPGIYIERFALTDSRGDVNTFEDEFVVEPGPPAGPTVATCGARSSSRHGKITAVHLTCASPNSGARVVVWLQRGSTVVADGVGTVRHGAATITLTGSFKRGTYTLVELVNAGGTASQSTHALKLK